MFLFLKMGLNIKIFQKTKENIILIIIVISFLFSYYIYYNPNADLWWDSSVYINMGKYIYSFGEVGLYEDSRPLIWPLILGLFWKLGLNPITFGKLMVLVFGIGTITLTYLISYNLFNKRIALISSLFLAFSPTFFLFNSIMFTEIPSAFFVALGFYFFIKKRYNIAGFIFGIAFMTRFFQIFVIFPVYLFFIYMVYKKKATIKQLLFSLPFFFIPIFPYFIINLILYNNPIYPFLLQIWMSKFTGWIFHQPFSFYFVNLLKENILVLFLISGLIFIFKNEEWQKFIVPFTFLTAFFPYNFIAHKEMRFLVSLFPFLYIMTAYGIIEFSNLFKKYKHVLLILIVFIGMLNVMPKLRLSDYDDKLDVFYEFIENKNIKQGLWVSNPSFVGYNNVKADELIYYPLYNTEKILKLKKKINNARYVLINTCDIMPCPPYEEGCKEMHSNFISMLKDKFKVQLYETRNGCEYYIFSI